MTAVLFIAGLALLVAAWLAAVERRYPLEGLRATALVATTADGWRLAVWHRAPAVRRFSTPVVLVHGLANNNSLFEFQAPHSLAQVLAAAGFDCFTVDLRGAGRSEAPHEGPFEVSFDDHVRLDVPAILTVVERVSGSRKVAWVGHSMGGLVALAASGSTLAGRLQALCTIGSPAYFHFPRRTRWLLRLGQWLAPWGTFDARVLRPLAPLAGRVNTRLADRSANLANLTPLAQRLLMANVFAPMWRGVLEQLEDWVTHDVFRGRAGEDYREAVRGLEVPTLIIGGSVDHLCPEEVSREVFALVGAKDKALALFGKAHGQALDYGHADLVVGRRVETEVYPVILGFLCAKAVALPAP